MIFCLNVSTYKYNCNTNSATFSDSNNSKIPPCAFGLASKDDIISMSSGHSPKTSRKTTKKCVNNCIDCLNKFVSHSKPTNSMPLSLSS